MERLGAPWSKVQAELSTASAWMSACLYPGSYALFKGDDVSIAEAGFAQGAGTQDLGEQPLACQRKSCIFRAPRTPGFDTQPSVQPAVDKGSTRCRLLLVSVPAMSV